MQVLEKEKPSRNKVLACIHSLAENEPRENSYFLRREERSKETIYHSFFGAKNEPRNIHPNQTFPYIGRLNQEVAETTTS